MYAVIRTGGKQYRVAPGDVIRIESRASADSNLEFSDVLAVSGGEGQIGRPPSDARVLGQVVEQGRGDKILVFHYKRKKQYKKDRKSTRLNSSHSQISYAVFCLKKKKEKRAEPTLPL